MYLDCNSESCCSCAASCLLETIWIRSNLRSLPSGEVLGENRFCKTLILVGASQRLRDRIELSVKLCQNAEISLALIRQRAYVEALKCSQLSVLFVELRLWHLLAAFLEIASSGQKVPVAT